MVEPASDSFAELLSQLKLVESLLTIGVFLVEQDRLRPTSVAQYEAALRNAEYLATRGFRTGHLQHNSPTDILLWAGAASGAVSAVTLAANRILAVWTNVQAGRLAKSRADLVVAANDRLMEEIASTRGRPLTDDDFPPELHMRLTDASRAIAQAEQITVDD